MIDPHSGDTGNKVETARRCRRLLLAIIGQAIKDATSQDAELKADAIDYLTNPDRSEAIIEAAGLYPYAFRVKILAAIENDSLEEILNVFRPFYEDSRVVCGDSDLEEVLHALDHSRTIDSGETTCANQ